MIKFPAVLITDEEQRSGVPHKRPVVSAAFPLGWGYSFTSYTFLVRWKAKVGIVGLKLNLNFIPCLHSSWDHLQVDVIWRRRILFVCRSTRGRGFPPLLHAWMWEKPPFVVAFWYGNMFFLLKSLFCNTVTLWFKPSGERGEKKKRKKKKEGQMLLLFSHLFLYFYFQVAVKGPSEKRLL